MVAATSAAVTFGALLAMTVGAEGTTVSVNGKLFRSVTGFPLMVLV